MDLDYNKEIPDTTSSATETNVQQNEATSTGNQEAVVDDSQMS